MDEILDGPEVAGALVDLALQGHHLQVQRRHLVGHVLLQARGKGAIRIASLVFKSILVHFTPFHT